MSTARLANLRAELVQRQLEGALVCKPENRVYLSGFTGSAGWLLVTPEKAYLVTDFRYVEQAAAQAPAFEVCKLATTQHPLIAELAGKLGLKQLAFEGDYLTVDEHTTFARALEGVELVPVSGMVEALRMIKDEAEVALMQKAASITDEAWTYIQSFIRPGVAERDVALELEHKMKKLGAEGLAFDIIVASGVRSSLPHGRASEKLIETGDLVTVDFGAQYQGYCADMTRTVMVGEPSEQQRRLYAIVLEAQQRGVAACKPGMTGKELDEVCRGYIRENGYTEEFGHGTGHGVGLYIHENPRLNVRAENDVLKPGMVVTIEPGVYLPGWGGVRIEDMVLVTDTGCRRLSQSAKELVIL